MPRSKPKGVGTIDLDQGQWRLLHWLERYPWQRAHDLVVALAPWEGRSAVYRRLAALATKQLVEPVHVGIAGKEPLYHLSPLGQHTCDAWRLAQGHQPQTPSLRLREQREQLARMLPRLPVWLVIQDLINGLVLGAASALAHVATGAPATMVRWNWLRDYRHPFVLRGQPERLLRVRADGALALCWRFATDQTSVQDWWQTFLLLFCPLDDGRLLKQRLDRLVRWRRSEEWAHRSASDQMPPVLILATTPRQAAWWQQAWMQVATTWKEDGPLGAVTSLPADRHLDNAWRLPWRTLGTNLSCHLRDLVHPEHAPALPELVETSSTWATAWPQHPSRQESVPIWHIPPCADKRSYELARKADEIAALVSAHGKGRAASGNQAYRLLGLLLTPRQWEMLFLCFAHPLLEREDLSVVLGMRPKSTQLVLTDLSHKGLLTQAVTPCGGRWHLTEAGLRLLARSVGWPVQRLVRLPVTPGVPLQQRGVAGLLHQIHHTAGMYAFFTDLMRSLASLPGARVVWWETGAACEHVFRYREQPYHFKPDALACVQFGDRTIHFWLEWDRGTMGVRDLERKCATYAAYLASRAWATTGTVLPTLVYVAPEIAQERRFVSTATALLAHLPALHVYTTTLSLLTTRGIMEPIWQHVRFQTDATPHTCSEHLPRTVLFAGEDEHTVPARSSLR